MSLRIPLDRSWLDAQLGAVAGSFAALYKSVAEIISYQEVYVGLRIHFFFLVL